MNVSVLNILREESFVGIQAAQNAEQLWIQLAHLDEVLRVLLCVRRKWGEAAAPLMGDLLHPLIQTYATAVAVSHNDPLVWSNQQCAVRLLRDPGFTGLPGQRHRSAPQLLEQFRLLCSQNPEITRYSSLGAVYVHQTSVDMARITVSESFPDDPEKIQIGITAGIHGDEAEGVYALYRWLNLWLSKPQLLRYYTFHLYPLLNPGGFETFTRHNPHGVDLNRDFTGAPTQTESLLLTREFTERRFDGLICLHSDDDTQGLYGYANGTLLSEALVRPALRVASTLIPINMDAVIDGHEAREGIIKGSFPGALSLVSTRAYGREPFDITLEVPNLFSVASRVSAHVLMLRTILDEYRQFIAQGANL
ncbi:MAG: succinylglutamate desuccinylase/aspartoacylase family protein [Verrucomicrobiae bacterium]|nr:succinylglutamate desuccinylase/aspartoacylase family protein [Verrucomicrobiae bacterium]